MKKLIVLEDPHFLDGATKRFKDDQFTCEDDVLANQYIELGWCKDAETGKSGKRVPGAKMLEVNPVNTKLA